MTIQQNWETVEHRDALSAGEVWGLDAHQADHRFYRKYAKRAIDLVLAILLLVVLFVPMLIVAALLLVTQGRPLIYSGHRMKAPGEHFQQYKFRTMMRAEEDRGATGAYKNWRITRLGGFLRRTRMDELPQLINIIRGDMSFVGPRPPLPEYVERFPSLYAAVLKARPGVTGLATLIYHRHEDKIMSRCDSAEETDRAYYARCLPTKLRIELIYRRTASPTLDMWIMWKTLLALIPGCDRPRKRRGR